MKKIKVTIHHKDGTQTIEVLDAIGADCLECTRELEKRLGTRDGERVLKPEYYEAERPTERDREVDR